MHISKVNTPIFIHFELIGPTDEETTIHINRLYSSMSMLHREPGYYVAQFDGFEEAGTYEFEFTDGTIGNNIMGKVTVVVKK